MEEKKIKSLYTTQIVSLLSPIIILVIGCFASNNELPSNSSYQLNFLYIFFPLYLFLFHFKNFILKDTSLVIQYPFNKWKKDVLIPLENISEVKFNANRGYSMTFLCSKTGTSKQTREMYAFDIKKEDLYIFLEYLESHHIKLSGKDAASYLKRKNTAKGGEVGFWK